MALDMRHFATRTGRLVSSSYSMETWPFPSGAKAGSPQVSKTRIIRLTSTYGSGRSSGVSSQAKPYMMP
ncbi:MAG: hypothetical protein A4E73_01287 [Syntrophaceae bacterium PtaU1.Bin231]|nr:MAG: hypothetical protein A4E73_01287 [Syntrophaceae bacterium PtaU1.Bin231]